MQEGEMLRILFLVTLLAVTPALAQDVQPGWTADPRNGCRASNEAPADDTAVKWSGACHYRAPRNGASSSGSRMGFYPASTRASSSFEG